MNGDVFGVSFTADSRFMLSIGSKEGEEGGKEIVNVYSLVTGIICSVST